MHSLLKMNQHGLIVHVFPELMNTNRILSLNDVNEFLDKKIKEFVNKQIPKVIDDNSLQYGRLGPKRVGLKGKVKGTLRIDEDQLYIMGVSEFNSIRSDVCLYDGRWMYEVRLNSKGVMQLGWCTDSCKFSDEKGVGDTADSYGFDGSRIKLWNLLSKQYGEAWEIGDVITCCIDLIEGKLEYFRNGRSLGLAYDKVKTGPGVSYFPAVSISEGDLVSFNFGERRFIYNIQNYQPIQHQNKEYLVETSCLMSYWERLIPITADFMKQTSSADPQSQLLEADSKPQSDISSVSIQCSCWLLANTIMTRMECFLKEKYICESCFIPFLLKFCDVSNIHSTQTHVSLVLDMIWNLFEKESSVTVMKNVIGAAVSLYEFGKLDATFTSQTKYLHLILAIVKHQRTKFFILENSMSDLLHLPFLMYIRMPEERILDDMVIGDYWGYPVCVESDCPKHRNLMKDIGTSAYVRSDFHFTDINLKSQYTQNIQLIQLKIRELEDIQTEILIQLVTSENRDDDEANVTLRTLFLQKMYRYLQNNINADFSTELNTSISKVLLSLFHRLINLIRHLWKGVVVKYPDMPQFEDISVAMLMYVMPENYCIQLNSQRIGGKFKHISKRFNSEIDALINRNTKKSEKKGLLSNLKRPTAELSKFLCESKTKKLKNATSIQDLILEERLVSLTSGVMNDGTYACTAGNSAKSGTSNSSGGSASAGVSLTRLTSSSVVLSRHPAGIGNNSNPGGTNVGPGSGLGTGTGTGTGTGGGSLVSGANVSGSVGGVSGSGPVIGSSASSGANTPTYIATRLASIANAINSNTNTLSFAQSRRDTITIPDINSTFIGNTSNSNVSTFDESDYDEIEPYSTYTPNEVEPLSLYNGLISTRRGSGSETGSGVVVSGANVSDSGGSIIGGDSSSESESGSGSGAIIAGSTASNANTPAYIATRLASIATVINNSNSNSNGNANTISFAQSRRNAITIPDILNSNVSTFNDSNNDGIEPYLTYTPNEVEPLYMELLDTHGLIPTRRGSVRYLSGFSDSRDAIETLSGTFHTSGAPLKLDYNLGELTSCLQLVEAVIALFHISANEYYPKVVAQCRQQAHNLITAVINISDRLNRVPPEEEKVKYMLEKTLETLKTKLQRVSRKFAFLTATDLSEEKRNNLLWLWSVLLSTFEETKSDTLYVFIPIYHIENCLNIFRFLTQIFHPTLVLEGLRDCNSVIGQYGNMLLHNYREKKIVSTNLKSQIVKGISEVFSHPLALKCIESQVTVSGAVVFLQSLVSDWADTMIILEKIWRGDGFAFRFQELPHQQSSDFYLRDAVPKVMERPNPSKFFQIQLKLVLKENSSLCTTMVNLILNKINWSFSEVVSNMQELNQHRGNRYDRLTDIRYTRTCSLCFDITVSFLRILEMIVTLCPEIFIDSSRQNSELFLNRLFSCISQIFNRCLTKGLFQNMINLKITGLDQIDYFPIIIACLGILISLILNGPRQFQKISSLRLVETLIRESNFMQQTFDRIIFEGDLIPQSSIDKKSETTGTEVGGSSDVSTSSLCSSSSKSPSTVAVDVCPQSTFNIYKYYPHYITREEIELSKSLLNLIRRQSSYLEKQSEEKEEDMCVICYAHPKNAIFKPCGHSACKNCISYQMMSNPICFFCKHNIKKVEDLSGKDLHIKPSKHS